MTYWYLQTFTQLCPTCPGYIRVFILDTKPGREPKKYPGAMSQYVLPTCIDIRKEKRKCKSRESWTKVSTAIPCHPLLLPAFLFMRKSAFSIDLFSERLLMSEIAVSLGGILFCRDQNERVSYTLENVDLASSYLVSGPKVGLKIGVGR